MVSLLHLPHLCGTKQSAQNCITIAKLFQIVWFSAMAIPNFVGFYSKLCGFYLFVLKELLNQLLMHVIY